LNDHQSLFPARPHGAQDNPQQPVRIPEPGLLGVPVEHEKLVPQSQVFEQRLAARSERCAQTPRYGKNAAKHDARSLAQLTD
jgi:hypothetical protein